MLEILQFLQGCQEPFGIDLLLLLAVRMRLIIDIAFFITVFHDRISCLVDHRHNIRFQERCHAVECRCRRIMPRISKMRIAKMQDDDHDHCRRVAAPMVQFSLAFIVSEDVSEILSPRYFLGIPNGNLVQRIPAG